MQYFILIRTAEEMYYKKCIIKEVIKKIDIGIFINSCNGTNYGSLKGGY